MENEYSKTKSPNIFTNLKGIYVVPYLLPDKIITKQIKRDDNSILVYNFVYYY